MDDFVFPLLQELIHWIVESCIIAMKTKTNKHIYNLFISWSIVSSFRSNFCPSKKPSRVCFSKKPGLQNLFSTYSGFFKASRFRGKNLVTFLTPTADSCCVFFFWVVETHHFCQRKIGVAAVVSIFFFGQLDSKFQFWVLKNSNSLTLWPFIILKGGDVKAQLKGWGRFYNTWETKLNLEYLVLFVIFQFFAVSNITLDWWKYTFAIPPRRTAGRWKGKDEKWWYKGLNCRKELLNLHLKVPSKSHHILWYEPGEGPNQIIRHL